MCLRPTYAVSTKARVVSRRPDFSHSFLAERENPAGPQPSQGARLVRRSESLPARPGRKCCPAEGMARALGQEASESTPLAAQLIERARAPALTKEISEPRTASTARSWLEPNSANCPGSNRESVFRRIPAFSASLVWVRPRSRRKQATSLSSSRRVLHVRFQSQKCQMLQNCDLFITLGASATLSDWFKSGVSGRLPVEKQLHSAEDASAWHSTPGISPRTPGKSDHRRAGFAPARRKRKSE